jgi:tRNA G18 (ribose-2'-O)-methylase SpoU
MSTVDERSPAALTIPVGDAADPRLADYRLLNDQAARRHLEGDEFFIAEGYVAIDRLIESDHRLRSVLLAPSRVERFADHLPALVAAGVPVYVVDTSVMTDVVGFDLHRGVIAAADRLPLPSISDVATNARRIAVLEGLNDAENLGAISRAARALGIDALVIDPTCTDPYSRRTVRVSMGEVLALPVARADGPLWSGTLDVLVEHGFETWAMTPAADAVDLWSHAAPARIASERIAVVFGAEGPGLDRRTMAAASHRVRIPIDPTVDSLNVGHAAAITFGALTRTSF